MTKQNTTTVRSFGRARLPDEFTAEFTAEDHAVQDALRAACALLWERGFQGTVVVTLANGRRLERDNF